MKDRKRAKINVEQFQFAKFNLTNQNIYSKHLCKFFSTPLCNKFISKKNHAIPPTKLYFSNDISRLAPPLPSPYQYSLLGLGEKSRTVPVSQNFITIMVR